MNIATRILLALLAAAWAVVPALAANAPAPAAMEHHAKNWTAPGYRIYAQALADEIMKAHPELLSITFHGVPPGMKDFPSSAELTTSVDTRSDCGNRRDASAGLGGGAAFAVWVSLADSAGGELHETNATVQAIRTRMRIDWSIYPRQATGSGV